MSFAPFSVFRDLNLSALNDENRGKTPEKIKPLLCNGHNVIDIILQILHYRHYIMDVLIA